MIWQDGLSFAASAYASQLPGASDLMRSLGGGGGGGDNTGYRPPAMPEQARSLGMTADSMRPMMPRESLPTPTAASSGGNVEYSSGSEKGSVGSSDGARPGESRKRPRAHEPPVHHSAAVTDGASEASVVMDRKPSLDDAEEDEMDSRSGQAMEGRGGGGSSTDGAGAGGEKKYRKSCDFCTTTKIRCDGLKPTCDNCAKRG